jgi:hypothetical protein
MDGAQTLEAGHAPFTRVLKRVDYAMVQASRDSVQKLVTRIEEHRKFTAVVSTTLKLNADIPEYKFRYLSTHRLGQSRSKMEEAYERFFAAAKAVDLHLEDLQRIDHRTFAQRTGEKARRRAQGMSPEQVRQWAIKARADEVGAQKHLTESLVAYKKSKEELRSKGGMEAEQGSKEPLSREELEEARAEQQRKDQQTQEALQKQREKARLEERKVDEEFRNEKQRRAAEERWQADVQAMAEASPAPSTEATPAAALSSSGAAAATQVIESVTGASEPTQPKVGWGTGVPHRRAPSDKNRQITTPRFSTGGRMRSRRVQLSWPQQ